MLTTYKVEFHKQCIKDLKKIPLTYRESIKETMLNLAQDPRPNGFKKLKGSNRTSLFRIRVGIYRIVYTIQDEKLLVLVTRVGHRKDVYR